MDLYHLKTFFILAKIKNFTQAASLLFVTQLAVSHAIKKLETSLDTALIKRNSKKLSLTPARHTLFQSCKKIFYEIERAYQNIALYKKESKVRIRVGSTVEFGTTILIKHIQSFLQANPGIHLDFYFSHHLEEPWARDEIDLAIDCKVHKFIGLEKFYLFQEQYITIASPEFVRKHKIQSLDDLENI